MSMRRYTKAAAAAVLTVGMAVVQAPDAEAVPRNCWSSGAGWQYARANCNQGTGSFQVWANCKQYIWPHFYEHIVGNWVRVGPGYSEVRCSLSFRTESTGVSLRN